MLVLNTPLPLFTATGMVASAPVAVPASAFVAVLSLLLLLLRVLMLPVLGLLMLLLALLRACRSIKLVLAPRNQLLVHARVEILSRFRFLGAAASG